MPWQVRIASRAEKDLRSLPPGDQAAARHAIDSLAVDPSSVHLRKLGGKQGEWRIRVGVWRILITFQSGVAVVERVLPRKDAYRD